MRPLQKKRSNAALTGLVKICDFGLSRTLSFSSSAAGTFLGTACYMSPERLNGQVGRPYSRLCYTYALPSAVGTARLRRAALRGMRKARASRRALGRPQQPRKRKPCGTVSRQRLQCGTHCAHATHWIDRRISFSEEYTAVY